MKDLSMIFRENCRVVTLLQKNSTTNVDSINFLQQCSACLKEYDASRHVTTCDCGATIQFTYDLTKVKWPAPRKSMGLMRFSQLLPIANPSGASSCLGPFSKPSPIRKSKVGDFLGLRNLWIKDETANFTKSFKAREAAVTVSRFYEIAIKEFVMASTGNTAAAFIFAMNLQDSEMLVHLFLPKHTILDFPTLGKNVQLHMLENTYHESIGAAADYSRKQPLLLEGGSTNPCRVEGCKTIAFELAEANFQPEWYVQAVTSGTGPIGLHKGFNELRNLGVVNEVPKLLCVQPERCAPMTNAFLAGRDSLGQQDIVSYPDSFVTTLANGSPSKSYPHLRRALLESEGTMNKVSETAIGSAIVLLIKMENTIPDPAAAVALAGLIDAAESGTIDKDAKILLNLSGGIRTGTEV